MIVTKNPSEIQESPFTFGYNHAKIRNVDNDSQLLGVQMTRGGTYGIN